MFLIYVKMINLRKKYNAHRPHSQLKHPHTIFHHFQCNEASSRWHHLAILPCFVMHLNTLSSPHQTPMWNCPIITKTTQHLIRIWYMRRGFLAAWYDGKFQSLCKLRCTILYDTPARILVWPFYSWVACRDRFFNTLWFIRLSVTLLVFLSHSNTDFQRRMMLEKSPRAKAPRHVLGPASTSRNMECHHTFLLPHNNMNL